MKRWAPRHGAPRPALALTLSCTPETPDSGGTSGSDRDSAAGSVDGTEGACSRGRDPGDRAVRPARLRLVGLRRAGRHAEEPARRCLVTAAGCADLYRCDRRGRSNPRAAGRDVARGPAAQVPAGARRHDPAQLDCEGQGAAGGAAVADYERDGWLDIVVTRLGAPDLLYRNRRPAGVRPRVDLAQGLAGARDDQLCIESAGVELLRRARQQREGPVVHRDHMRDLQ